MSEEKSIEKSFVVSHLIKQNKQLKQRNKEFFIAGFEAGKLNQKKANHKMPGTIMHADSAYEAYLGYRDIQNES